jgi:hypothetical protein
MRGKPEFCPLQGEIRESGIVPVTDSDVPRGLCIVVIPLLEAPYRVGKPLRATLSGFHSARLGTQWRVLYRIDEAKHAVIVQDIQPRSSARRRR